jgi:energy-coupling factor transporter ATP-binding protein EcfA2
MCNWQTTELNGKHLGFTPKKIIGEVDSHAEWSSEREEESASKFVHTDSYRTVCEKSTLFVFGRRGTGKSAILQMLNFEINQKKIKTYSNSIMINQEDVYHGLAIQLRNSPLCDLPLIELIHTIKEKWNWVIKVSGMFSIYEDSSISTSEKQKIKGYLSSLSIIKNNGQSSKFKPFKFVTDTFAEELDRVDCLPTKLGAAIFRISKRLFTPDFEDAEEEMYELLKSKKKTILVLIDSIERYNIKDKVSESVAVGLIDSLLKLYNESDRGLYAKAFFPSEIIPHMTPSNWSKTEDKVHVIKWSYNDLRRMLAKRYFKSIIKTDATKTEITDFCKDLPNSLYNYFPKEITTRSGIRFDTISYIISHTQKKPREFIFLVNCILTLAELEKVDCKQLTEKVIVDGMHILIESLFRDATNMYETIYPDASAIIRKTLSEAPAYFGNAELDVMLQEINTYLKKDSLLTKDDIKDLFLQSGIIGIMQEKRKLSDSKNILLALFEYQIKGTLSLQSKTTCVIHPMFYQALRIKTDINTFTYPTPAEEEVEFLTKAVVDNQ